MSKVEIPETRYARNGPVSIAYQVVGDGRATTLYVPPGVGHLDIAWENDLFGHVLRRLAAWGRLVLYDMRGCGLSDRSVATPTVEENVSDLMTVLDNVGVEEVDLVGVTHGAAVALAAAAQHPDRVRRVAVLDGFAKAVDDVFVFGDDEASFAERTEALEGAWGTDAMARMVAPSRGDDPEFLAWFSRMNRAALSPAGAAVWLDQMRKIDIRGLLPDVSAPVLVVNRASTRAMNPKQSHFLAEQLPDARHVEFPGEDMLLVAGDTDAILDEVEAFFTGTRPTRAPTRALATVMFTDIVHSTETAAEVGDTVWRDLLARHDERTRHHVEAHGGRVVKSTGDGALATFETPGQAIAAAQSLTADLAGAGVELRVGIHMGEVEILGEDVAGLGVHLAARISSVAQPGEVLVSRTVRDLLLGSDFAFTDRGTHELKGIPDRWQVLAVVGDPPPPSSP
jgi:class 3 adenylate cyclase